jgi:hypothetical protein
MPDETLAASKPKTIQDLLKPTTTMTQKGSKHVSPLTTPVLNRVVFPCRYAVICSEDEAMLNKLAPNKLPVGNLGKNLVPLNDTKTTRYGIRQLRSGFLYVFVERTLPEHKGTQCKCEVAVSVGKDGKLHNIGSYGDNPFDGYPFFKVNDVTPKSIVRMLFTPDPLTDRMIYQITDDKDLRGKLQKIDLQRNDMSDQIEIAQLNQYVAEAIAGSDQKSRDALAAQSPLSSKIFIPEQFAQIEAILGEDLEKRFLKGFCAVLDDPIGITQDLNNWRNAAVQDHLTGWYAQPMDHNPVDHGVKVDNKWGAAVSSNYQRMRDLYPKARVAQDLKEYRNSQAAAIERKYHFQEISQRQYEGGQKQMRPDENGNMKVVWENDASKEYDEALAKVDTDLDKLVLNYIPVLQQKADDGYYDEEFERRYVATGKIDENALAMQNAAFKNQLQLCENLYNGRVENCVAWIQSEQLLVGFDVYDVFSPENGVLFKAQTGRCVVGQDGTQSLASIADDYWFKKDMNRENILWRAYAFNQEDTISALKSLKSSITEDSFSSGEAEVLATIGWAKNIQDAFDKTREAYEKSGGVPDADYSIMGSMLAIDESFGTRVLKMHLPNFVNNGLQKGMRSFATSVMVGSVGKISADFGHADFPHIDVHQIYEQIVTRKNPDGSSWLGEKFARVFVESPETMYYKVRGGVVLALLECVMLISTIQGLKDEQNSAKIKLALSGQLMLIAGALFEIAARVYSATMASVEETSIVYKGMAVKVSSWRFAGGAMMSYGAFEQGISDWIDAVTYYHEKEYKLVFAFGARTFSNLAVGVGTGSLALASGKEFFAWAAKKYPQSLFLAALKAASGWAAGDVIAEVMAQVVRYNIYITLGITAIMILLQDTPLEAWYKKSIFRGSLYRVNYAPFATANAEMQAMNAATGSTD